MSMKIKTSFISSKFASISRYSLKIIKSCIMRLRQPMQKVFPLRKLIQINQSSPLMFQSRLYMVIFTSTIITVFISTTSSINNVHATLNKSFLLCFQSCISMFTSFKMTEVFEFTKKLL